MEFTPLLFSLLNQDGFARLTDIPHLRPLTCPARATNDKYKLKPNNYEQGVSSKTEAHQTLERHSSHPRHGSDSDYPTAHRNPILQWSQGAALGKVLNSKTNIMTTAINIITILLGVITSLDIITFVLQSTGSANNLTYYICRPLWGLLEISMFKGLLVRIIEIVVATFCINHLVTYYLS